MNHFTHYILFLQSNDKDRQLQTTKVLMQKLPQTHKLVHEPFHVLHAANYASLQLNRDHLVAACVREKNINDEFMQLTCGYITATLSKIILHKMSEVNVAKFSCTRTLTYIHCT